MQKKVWKVRNMSREKKDLVIIGSGPAGLSAAVYGKRAMLNEVVIEKDVYGGGQIAVTERVDNYLGLYGMSGYDLVMKFKEHANALGVPFYEGEVSHIKCMDDKKIIVMDDGAEIETKSVIIATGASYKQLGCAGEDELKGAGVSYCATCDGAFFKNKTVAVVGGGNVALGDALYLANICEKVYLIHRRDQLRGAKSLQQKVFEKENIEFLPSKEIKEIIGKESVEKIILQDVGTTQTEEKNVDGIFVAVGMQPNSQMVSDIVKTDDNGYIIADESCKTSVDGIYAVGDVRTKQLRQVVTAVSDGAVAISTLEQDMLKNNR